MCYTVIINSRLYSSGKFEIVDLKYLKEKSSEYSRASLSRIEKEGLLPIPCNYELWFVYYSRSNGDVVSAIDAMVSADKSMDDEWCAEIHKRFLSYSGDGDQVMEAGALMKDTITDMSGRFNGIKSAASEYGAALHDASAALADKDIDPQALRKKLDVVSDNTRGMIEQNEQLEKDLERSATIMAELQKDLEEVRKQAFTDGLTNLANRKAFDDELERVIAASQESGDPFTLVLMDIDHFKSFNDNYGHQVGDQVLRLVARTLIDGVKGRDFAARYGGEEFALILPETDMIGGIKVADALRKVVQGKELVNRNTGDILGRITLSGGVAEYVAGEDVGSIIQRADMALYSAKHNGRNQISSAK